jgi:TetR/AcrR family transcriptional regulator
VLREVAEARGEPVEAISETAGAAFLGAIAGAGLEWLRFRQDRPLSSIVDQVLALMPR